ncbi:FAD-dependent monooxygenase [Loktanella sp. M215]|uniref:FAD-dependent monooxygenase n=1 Tax=Loktanella sp. M215 TaxID=2675431 RepID=UPI001F02B3EF|nr:FAD-dependent monooxygenase [Loktanella sp. M215]MCF7700457.1 NAD(P)-binding protein [Loktanella sp. M215]
MIARSQVAVIGSGIGGLATALALAMQGASVRVFEQAPRIAEVGAGLQITPNGARVLDWLGLGDALDAKGLRAEAVVPMDGLTGRAVTRFDLSRQSPPYRFVARPDLIDMLATACRHRGVEIVLDHRAEALPEADLVVGADGIRSVTRGLLNGDATPQFTGQVAWRATIASAAPPEARIWMLPRRHIVTYPLSSGLLNIVAVQERSAWADEGWHHADDPAHLRDAFPDACGALQKLLMQVEHPHLWGLFQHPVAPVWVTDRVALVGDAAHPTLPFLAQGANLALEDAAVLARQLALHGLADGLPRYQAARRARVTRAIAAASANAANYHLGGPRRVAAHLGLRALGRIAPDAFIGRMNWLYGFDATA